MAPLFRLRRLKMTGESGRNATEGMRQNLEILYDELLAKWNYHALPQM